MKIEWDHIQKIHDGGVYIKDIMEKYEISRWYIVKATKNGLLTISKSKKVSEETKKKISIGRSKYLKENKDKHPWSKPSKFKSEPCEHLKNLLTEKGINFIEEYRPLPNRRFRIDISFPDKKIGIEINGNQHYNRDGSLKPYYNERHNLIENEGWKLYELHYKIPYGNNINNIINDITHSNEIHHNFDYETYLINEINYQKKTKKCIDCGDNISRVSKRCRKCNNVNKTKNKSHKCLDCDHLIKDTRTKRCVKCHNINRTFHTPKEICSECSSQCTGNMCVGCYSIKQRKVERPPYDQLLKELSDSNYSALGRKYGVSDTAIRKWIKSYEK